MATRERYFAAAYELMADGDPAAVTIDALCRAVGTTSGSYYHHFGSHAGFVQALADHWYERSVEQAAKQAADASTALEARRLLRRAIQATDHHVDAAMRAWARTSAPVADAVRKADARRREVARTILGSILPDASAAELDAYAELVQLVFIGAQSQQPDRASAAINRVLDTFVALLQPGARTVPEVVGRPATRDEERRR